MGGLNTITKMLLRRTGILRFAKRDTGTGRIAHSGSEFEAPSSDISEFIVEKLIPIVGVRPYPLEELSLMVSAVCWLRPSHLFEWGTHVGKSARIFYETARHFRIGTEIHSIDLPDDVDHVEHPHQKRGHFVRGIKDVRLYQGDGVTTALGIWSKAKGTVTLPLFFLDGDHEFTSVLRELKTIHENIKGAGMLVHDTFYQSAESGYNIGPYLAIQEFLKSNPSPYRRLDTKLGLPGMTLLYQR